MKLNKEYLAIILGYIVVILYIAFVNNADDTYTPIALLSLVRIINGFIDEM